MNEIIKLEQIPRLMMRLLIAIFLNISDLSLVSQLNATNRKRNPGDLSPDEKAMAKIFKISPWEIFRSKINICFLRNYIKKQLQEIDKFWERLNAASYKFDNKQMDYQSTRLFFNENYLKFYTDNMGMLMKEIREVKYSGTDKEIKCSNNLIFAINDVYKAIYKTYAVALKVEYPLITADQIQASIEKMAKENKIEQVSVF